MFSNPVLRSLARCEMYLGALLLAASIAFVVPPLFSIVGVPMAMDLAVALMTAGFQGLLSVSVLGFCALPFLH